MDILKSDREECKRNPDAYWTRLANQLYWHKKWDKLKDTSDMTSVKWFLGGQINLNYNSLDVPIKQGFGDKVIIMHECFYTKRSETFTYSQVLDEVSRLAGYLDNLGVRAGDHILINMPMVPEALFAIHACVRIGAPYGIIQRGYNAQILQQRIEAIKPKVIFTVNVGFYETDTMQMKEILDNALKMSSHQPIKCIVFQRPKLEKAKLIVDRDIDYIEARDSAKAKDCVPVESNSPLFIIHTSGSTGKPKGIIHGHGLYGINVLNSQRCFGIQEGEVHLSFSQLGWIIGNLTYAYAVFLMKTPAIIYEGPLVQPDVRGIYNILVRHQVDTLFISCSNLRYLNKMDESGQIAKEYEPFKLRLALVSGSQLNERDANHFRGLVKGVSIIQLYGQTEMGSGCTTNPLDKNGHPIAADKSAGKLLPGYEIKILREDGTELPNGEIGQITFKLPLPPGTAVGILDEPDLFKQLYCSTFPGFFDTKDYGKIDDDGNLYIDERSDGRFKFREDRYTTAGVEEIILSNADVVECVVVLKTVIDHKEKRPVAFYRIKESCTTSETEFKLQLLQKVRNELGPAFPLDEIYRVKVFPKGETKISKGTIQYLVNNNKTLKEPPNADLPGILDIWNAIK